MSRSSVTHGYGRCVVLAALLGMSIPFLFASGCEAKKQPATAAGAAEVPVVYTTFYPTMYFVQRIGGDKVRVVCPCPPDADPAFWMPDEKTVAAYQQADLIVVNGASFEKWLEKATLPEARLVDTTRPFADEFIVIKDAVTHTHGPAGKHSHEGIDGHTWLDPLNAKVQAGEIKRALVKRFADHKQTYEDGYAGLAADLDGLDARLKSLAEAMGAQWLLASHPAYNYIGRRYGWQLKTFHLDPETMPDEETFSEIKAALEQHPAKYMLWEAEPMAEIKSRLRDELALESIVFSPCEALGADQVAAGADFLSVMNGNVDRLKEVFRP